MHQLLLKMKLCLAITEFLQVYIYDYLLTLGSIDLILSGVCVEDLLEHLISYLGHLEDLGLAEWKNM